MTKVLVVDDAEFLRVRITKMLTGEGYEVKEAENGAKAVEIYQQIKPDVVLMDITMPEMDGLTALKNIRGLDPNARIIMLTALGQESVVMEAVKAGAKDFVVKPYDGDRVLQAISKAIK
ncbi:MAG: response regulator [Leptolinea sp.]|jgi:two-component system chemotaxis response regulator CheY|nr:response regulator [Leptolinea sp.]